MKTPAIASHLIIHFSKAIWFIPSSAIFIGSRQSLDFRQNRIVLKLVPSAFTLLRLEIDSRLPGNYVNVKE